jgi:hypothetical protein
MVAWWKRLLFSFISMVAAAVVCLGCLVLESAFKSHPGSFRGSEVMLTIAVTVGLCLVGCVFTVPVVLMITNIRGWRFWLYWALGSAFGPLLILALCALVFFLVPHGPNERWFRPELLPLVYLAAAISSLTSLFYLLLLRRAQSRAAAGASIAPVP